MSLNSTPHPALFWLVSFNGLNSWWLFQVDVRNSSFIFQTVRCMSSSSSRWWSILNLLIVNDCTQWQTFSLSEFSVYWIHFWTFWVSSCVTLIDSLYFICFCLSVVTAFIIRWCHKLNWIMAQRWWLGSLWTFLYVPIVDIALLQLYPASCICDP